jgi:hypothetical protein
MKNDKIYNKRGKVGFEVMGAVYQSSNNYKLSSIVSKSVGK